MVRIKSLQAILQQSNRNFQGTSMSEFVTVAKVGDIPEGQGTAYPVGEKVVAVFNDGGKYYAINDACPHMGSSLAEGQLENGIVACPWHGWRFRISDGAWCDAPKVKTDCYVLRVVGEEIQVRVPAERKRTQQGSAEGT